MLTILDAEAEKFLAAVYFEIEGVELHGEVARIERRAAKVEAEELMQRRAQEAEIEREAARAAEAGEALSMVG